MQGSKSVLACIRIGAEGFYMHLYLYRRQKSIRILRCSNIGVSDVVLGANFDILGAAIFFCANLLPARSSKKSNAWDALTAI